jgi:uncharacterized protein involved in outer membrane biogenesis
MNLKNMALKVSLRAKNLNGLKPLAGGAIAGMGPVSFSGEIKGNLSKVRVESLKLTVGNNDLSGRVEAGFGGPKLFVSATLSSNLFDLDSLFPKKKEKAKAKKKSAAKSKSSGKIFSNTPLPLDSLDQLDADISFSGKEIRASGLTLRGLKVRLSVKNRKLSVKILQGQMAGGRLKGELNLNAGGRKPSFSVRLDAANFDLGKILIDSKVSALYSGKGSVFVNLRGRENSVAAIMGSLNGETKVVMGKGRLKTEALDLAVGGFSKVLGTLTSKKKNYSVVNCAVIRFDIKNGIARSRVMLIDTEFSTVAGKGKIDLRRETLDLTVTPKSKSATLSIAIPVNVKGTLASPSFRPDAMAVARKLGGIAALFVFPPAAIAGFGDMGSGKGSECLKSARKKRVPSRSSSGSKKPSGPDVLKSVSEGLRSLFGQ